MNDSHRTHTKPARLPTDSTHPTTHTHTRPHHHRPNPPHHSKPTMPATAATNPAPDAAELAAAMDKALASLNTVPSTEAAEEEEPAPSDFKLKELRGELADEILLKDNPGRYVIFPIQHQDVSCCGVKKRGAGQEKKEDVDDGMTQQWQRRMCVRLGLGVSVSVWSVQRPDSTN